MMKPLIIDCCLYNGEELLFERLDYLYDMVDLFILVEFKETFSGIKKPQYYLEENKERLQRYQSKLKYICQETFPPMPKDWRPNITTEYPEAWWRENYQRNLPYSYLIEITDPFILLGCDLDEIPRRELLQRLPDSYSVLTEGCKLSMTMHYYSWNWVKKYRWTHPFVVNDIGLKQICSLEPFRTGGQCPYVIPQAGWHCSYFMSINEMVRKLEHFPHMEYNQQQYKTNEWIHKCIDEGLDLFNRGDSENLIPYHGEEGYPKKAM